jgi:hypothetical protein
VDTVDDEEEVTLAEAWLVRPQTEQLAKQGIMPFLCVRGKGAMQLARFLSLAQPAKDQPACDLQGRWNQSGLAPAPRTSAPPAPKVGVVEAVPPVPRPARAAPPPEEPAESASEAEERREPSPEEPAESAPVADEALQPSPEEPAESAPEAEVSAAAESPAPPAEEEMDPDLAALLKQLE